MTLVKLIDAATFLLLLATLWALDTVAGAGTNPLEIVRYGVICGLEASIVVLAILEARRRPVSLRLSTGGGLLVLFMAYTAISIFWSAGGTQSVLKDVLLALTIGTCLAIAALRPTRVLVQLLVIGCGTFVVLGVLAVIFMPGIGIETGWGLAGKWRGISTQKNNFGGLVALSLVYAIIQLVIPPATGHRRGPFALTTLWAVFLVFCLIMSGSRGAQMSAVLGTAGLVFTRLSRRVQNLVLFGGGVLAIPMLVLVLTTLSIDSTELNVAGLSFDTSSRTQIWSYGLEQLGSRVLLGFGPSGFWTPERSEVFLANNGWVLDNFHSGYVTALMEGGLVGAGLLLAALVGCFSHLRRLSRQGDRWIAFTFSFFCIIITENVVENIFGRSTDFLFVSFLLLMLSSTAILSPATAPQRRGIRPRPALPASGGLAVPPQPHTESSHG